MKQRYAVVDVDDQGVEYLAYLTRDLPSAEDLAQDEKEGIGRVYSVGPCGLRCKDDVPCEHDGRPETSRALWARVKPHAKSFCVNFVVSEAYATQNRLPLFALDQIAAEEREAAV